MSAAAKKSVKRKKLVLTLAQKIDICHKLERGITAKALMEEYNIGSSTIYDIKKQKNDLLKYQSKGDKTGEKRKTMKKVKNEDLDDVLYEWFKLKRAEGVPMTGPMICEKAEWFQQRLNIADEHKNLKFSAGWLHSFKLRHGIRRLDVSGEKKSADAEAAMVYTETFANLISENNLTPEQVYNADETGLMWRCIPESTLAAGDEKSASGFKKNKERLTVLVCANAAGTHRLKLLVIGKFKNPRAFKNILHLPVHYDAQASAWMDKTIFSNWFHHKFAPSVKNHFSKVGLPEDSKAILLLDNCRAHPHESQLISGNIFTAYLPPNVTSLIQPMDQGVIQNLKCHYKKSFLRQLIGFEGSVKDFQSQFTIKDAVYACNIAWKDVKKRTLQRSWRKLWPANIFEEGSSDEEEFEGFHVRSRQSLTEEIRDKARIAPANHPIAQMNDDQLNEWAIIDDNAPIAEELTDSDLVETVLNPTPEQEILLQDEDEMEEETSEMTSWSEVIEMLGKIIKFTERKACFDSKMVMQFCVAKNIFEIKRHEQIKQADIRNLFKSQSIGKKTKDRPMPSTPEIVVIEDDAASTSDSVIEDDVTSASGSGLITEPVASTSAVND